MEQSVEQDSGGVASDGASPGGLVRGETHCSICRRGRMR